MHPAADGVWGIIDSRLYGANFTGTVIGNTFNNCTHRDKHASIRFYTVTASANTSVYIVNNNKFLNSRGDYSGGITMDIKSPYV